MQGSYNVTVVQSIFPTSLPSSKEIWITICNNYWLLLKVKLPHSLSNVIFLLPCFSHWMNAFKGNTSDSVEWVSEWVVNFEQITDPLRPFFFNFLLLFFLSIIIIVTIVVFDANHTRKKMKSLWAQWVNFHPQEAYCLKTEALVVLSIWSISCCKSNRSKRDEYWSLTFPVKQSKMFHFWMLKSIIG